MGDTFVPPPFTTNNMDPKWSGLWAEKDTNKLNMDDFFNLVAKQLSNQDFMNPTDDSQYITQLAQMNTLQAMQEMTASVNANYSASLIGKYAVVSKIDEMGNLRAEEGYITKVSLYGGDYEITVNGLKFKLNNLMELTFPKTEEKPDPPEEPGDGDGTDEPEPPEGPGDGGSTDKPDTPEKPGDGDGTDKPDTPEKPEDGGTT